MDSVGYLTGLAGVFLVALVIYLFVGYLRLRRSSKNLKETT